MGFWELCIIAVGLSADAFAVSLCKGLSMRRLNAKVVVAVPLFFGLFQAGMPLLGYFLASRFRGYVESFDHWIAFALLSVIGIKMFSEALKEPVDDDSCGCRPGIRFGELLLLSLATSIDALAVGITFAILSVHLLPASSTIGLMTLILSLGGIYIGHRFGVRFKKPAEIAGGLILILMGLKILAEHLIFA